MKILFWGLPVLLGLAAVVQGGMNRDIGAKYGWVMATLLNNVVSLGIAFVIAAILFLRERPVLDASTWSWSYLIPGGLGVIFVLGLPYAIEGLGASRAIILLVTSQIAMSLLWDLWVLEVAIPWTRWGGALIAIGGALLASF